MTKAMPIRTRAAACMRCGANEWREHPLANGAPRRVCVPCDRIRKQTWRARRRAKETKT